MRNASPLSACIVAALAGHAVAHGKSYGPGVTDAEIRLGQTVPYSGPASGLSALDKAQVAYFAMMPAAE